jgi:hypothetical protein
MSRKGTDFSRIKPAVDPGQGQSPVGPPDLEGRRALFSAGGELPAEAATTGSVTIDCGSCGEESVLSPSAALRHALPSVHLPFLKRDHGSWMRCPACRAHTWVSVRIQLP